MNLATRWNPLYWQCACLCVNAGNYVDEIGADNGENDEDVADINIQPEETEAEERKTRHIAPNYGKIAKAISDSQLTGVKIELPDINTAQTDFVPDIEHNSILYSLQAINVVSDELLDNIIQNRPYSSLQDFLTKVSPTQTQMIGLIKAGCFDALCNKPRAVIMNEYLQILADEVFPLKDKLTSVQLKKALELGMQLPDYGTEVRIFNFKRYIDAHQNDKVNKRYILSSDSCIKFFNIFIEPDLSAAKNEYWYLPDNSIAVKQSAFKRVYDAKMEALMNYINTDEGRHMYQETLQQDFINNLKSKYCSGSISKWEMDTMCFYYSGHELAKMNNGMYNTRNFNDLPEYPEAGQKPCTITGTVTDSNNTRHTVTLLTNYGTVDVKLYAGMYTQFNQTLSSIDPETKKKTVLEKSWFQRGNKLIIHGVRRENMFCCKQDYSSGYSRSIGLIEDINYDGTLQIRYSRAKK